MPITWSYFIVLMNGKTTWKTRTARLSFLWHVWKTPPLKMIYTYVDLFFSLPLIFSAIFLAGIAYLVYHICCSCYSEKDDWIEVFPDPLRYSFKSLRRLSTLNLQRRNGVVEWNQEDMEASRNNPVVTTVWIVRWRSRKMIKSSINQAHQPLFLYFIFIWSTLLYHYYVAKLEPHYHY